MRTSSFTLLCVLAALGALAPGCGSDDDASVYDAWSPPPVIEAPVPQPPPPPEPTIVAQGEYYAVFVGDELDRCIEHTRRYEIPFGVEWSPRPLPPLDPIPDGRVIELSVDCASSFVGRTVLASCDGSNDLTLYQDVDAGIGTPPAGVTMLESYATRSYLFETALDDDVRLEACLAMQRRWTAVPDGSPEYARARAAMRDRERRRLLR